MSRELRAGAAKYDITPPAEDFPVFNKPNGAGGPDSIFKCAHDPLYIRAMVIENDENRVLVISYDWGGIDSIDDEGTKYLKIAAETAGIPMENILVGATHNHSALDMHYAIPFREKYPDFWEKAVRYEKMIMEEAIPTVVKEAIARLQPAKIGYGKTKCYANVTRHSHSETGEPSIYGFEPGAPSDKDLTVLNVRTLNDQPIGVIYNYGAHASLLANNKPDGEHTELSGDWPGDCSRKVEAALGNDAVALFLPGGAGDQNAVIIARVYDIKPDGGGIMYDFGPAGYIVLDFIGNMISKSVLEAIDAIPDSAYKTSTRLWIRKDSQEVTREYFRYEGDHYTYMPEDHPRYTPPVFQFTCFMLGDIALAATNGEIYSEIAMRFKEDSPYRQTMFISLGGGHLTYVRDVTGSGPAELLIRERLYRLMRKYSDGE